MRPCRHSSPNTARTWSGTRTRPCFRFTNAPGRVRPHRRPPAAAATTSPPAPSSRVAATSPPAPSTRAAAPGPARAVLEEQVERVGEVHHRDRASSLHRGRVPGGGGVAARPVREVRQPPLPPLLVGRHHVAAADRRPRRPGTLFPARGHAFNRRPCLLVLVAGHRKEQRHTPLLPCARISRSPLVVVPQHDCPHHSPSLEFLSSLVDARSTRRRPRASRTRRSPTRSREGGGATVVVRHLDAGSAGRQKRPTPPKACAPTRTNGLQAADRARMDARPAPVRGRRAPSTNRSSANGRGPPGGPQHSALCGVFGGVVTGEQPYFPFNPVWRVRIDLGRQHQLVAEPVPARGVHEHLLRRLVAEAEVAEALPHQGVGAVERRGQCELDGVRLFFVDGFFAYS